ncbi:hypothetical protein ACN47E_003656 [Coniothyrium glycines]
MATRRLCLFVVFSLVTRSLQQDPIIDFCRRWGHHTAQIDGRLYLDGGMVKYNQQSLNYSNTYLLFNDLNSPRQGTGFPTQYFNVTKPANVPSVSGGYTWADETNKCFYQFGGEYAPGSSPTGFSMWTYDTILDEWNKTEYKNADRNLQRVSFGAGTQVESSGLGFYYGGYMNDRNTPGWTGPALATSNIVRFEFSTGVLKNATGPDNMGRAEGQLIYVPVSDSGILVYFGGVEDPYHNGTNLPANMTAIHIYDIKSSKWYRQTATGDVPAQRRQFCAGAVWADDKSSFNIYLYGGYGFSDPLAFNDVYILSLPSFQWIHAYNLDPAAPSPDPTGHGGCSANVVNGDQMIIIGGWFPQQGAPDCDSPDTQGLHNLVMGNNTAKGALWDQFDPQLNKYAVPAVVIAAIGGGPTGGATVTAPATWNHADLATYATLRPTFAPRSATRLIPQPTLSPNGGSNKTNIGAIIGGVLGGLVALIFVLSVVLLCLRRRKKRAMKTESPSERPYQAPPPAELAVGSTPQEMSTRRASKYVTSHGQPFHENYANHVDAPPIHTQYAHCSHSSPSQIHQVSPQSYAPPYFATPPQQLHSESYSHHTPHQSGDAELFFTHNNATIPSPQMAYDHSVYQSQATPSLQRQYSYPAPTPLSHVRDTSTEQLQTFYPPPGDPAIHLHHSQLSFRDQRGSPTTTQYSGTSENITTPNTSATATPAHFYSQAAQVPPVKSAIDSQSPGSDRPAHGRFIESRSL